MIAMPYICLAPVQPIADIVYNVTLVENPELPSKNECVTASKALSQVRHQIYNTLILMSMVIV